MAVRSPSLRDRLAGLGLDDHLDLAETALLVAALTRPAAIAPYLDRLDELAMELAGCQADAAEHCAAALARILVERHDFRPDDGEGDESDCANLMWVLDQGQGTAEALGIVWLEVARRAGWYAEGLAFPGRFLVRLDDGVGGRVIVDPAEGGRAVAPFELRAALKAVAGLAAELRPSLFAPLSNRDIMLRHQNEVKLRVLRCGRVADAVAVVEATLLFAPNQPGLWREAGMMHMRLDNLPAAIAALEQFVARIGNHPAKRRTEQLLQEIRARLL